MSKEVFKKYREESRSGWGCNMPADKGLTMDQITLGAVLRIADSLESIDRRLNLIANRPETQEINLRRKVTRLENKIKKMKTQETLQ